MPTKPQSKASHLRVFMSASFCMCLCDLMQCSANIYGYVYRCLNEKTTSPAKVTAGAATTATSNGDRSYSPTVAVAHNSCKSAKCAGVRTMKKSAIIRCALESAQCKPVLETATTPCTTAYLLREHWQTNCSS
eukprot:11674-Heterococcus_DN1.PRE.1